MASSVLQTWDGTRRTSGTWFKTKTFFVKTNVVTDLRTGNMISVCIPEQVPTWSRCHCGFSTRGLLVQILQLLFVMFVWRFHKTDVLRCLKIFAKVSCFQNVTAFKTELLSDQWHIDWLLLLLIWSALKFLSVSSCVIDLPHMVSQHAPVLPAADVLQVWRRADDSWLRADWWSAAHTPHTHSASSVNQSISQ